MKAIYIYIIIIFAFLLSACNDSSEQTTIKLPQVVDFNIHIKPILSDRCFACHGPDKATQKAGLVLYAADSAYAELNENPGHFAIVPGSTAESEVVRRITSTEDQEIMPPPESNLSLNEYEKQLIIKWIEQGAEYKKHWSFSPVLKPELPYVQDSGWVSNPIDNFILAKHELLGIRPEAEATKEKLLRRVTFDITGLPPTIAEIDSFLADDRKDAYEKVVDRLLSSVAYAERMTARWLDIARYSDSHGYQVDFYRSMWPWREWVIKAYHENKPFDEFITWQLAGDLLPNATYEQKLATGFNRNHSINQEGGIIDEEFRVEYVADRTNTLGASLLGLTLECARCHTHKYDPISQKNYYELYSFFNSVPEKGYEWGAAPGPSVTYPSEKLDSLRNYLKQISSNNSEKLFDRLEDVNQEPQNDLKFTSWLEKQKKLPTEAQDAIPLEKAYFPFEKTVESNTILETVRPGRFGAGYFLSNDHSFNLGTQEFIRSDQPFTISFSFFNKYYLNRMQLFAKLDSDLSNGIAITSHFRYLHVTFTGEEKKDEIKLISTDIIPDLEWAQITITYDGTGTTNGYALFVNGEQMELLIDDHKRVPHISKSNDLIVGPKGLKGSGIDEIYLFDKALSPDEIKNLLEYNPIDIAARTDFSKLGEATKIQLVNQFLYHYDETVALALRNLDAVTYKYLDIPAEEELSVMTMAELPTPNPTFILRRGAYDAPGQQVYPGTPKSILSFSDSLPKNRLGLARWLMDPKNPLTSRVAVNRLWQYIFGQGIVKTVEDFGNQGELPSHPELLDWLAATYMEEGWNTKAMIKLIVMSSTYRQSSSTDKEKRSFDPDNVFLARGSRYRLPAEMIRDQALAASGLLNKKVGGPGVRPYQPENLWSSVTAVGGGPLAKYILDISEDLYRRSLYNFWKRTVPPPSMLTFDASTRDRCIVSRQVTNTPMQALILMNGPQYMEAARAMAQKLLWSNNSLEENLTLAFRKLTGRRPSDNELEILQTSYQESLIGFNKNPLKSSDLLQVGDYAIDTKLDQNELAALTVSISTILNLDETISKE